VKKFLLAVLISAGLSPAFAKLEIVWPTPNDGFLEGKPYEAYIRPHPSEDRIESGLFGCVRNNRTDLHKGIDIKATQFDWMEESLDPVHSGKLSAACFVCSDFWREWENGSLCFNIVRNSRCKGAGSNNPTFLASRSKMPLRSGQHMDGANLKGRFNIYIFGFLIDTNQILFPRLFRTQNRIRMDSGRKRFQFDAMRH
jgi:hypothetical protein